MPSFSFDSFASMSAPQSAPVSPAVSRSNSVTSVTSHKSAPHGTPASSSSKVVDRSRSIATTQTSSAKTEHGLKHFFSAEGRAERKEKKRLEQEKLDRVVLTSKHSATVKTRMLLERRNRQNSKTAGVVGTTQSAHLTAAQQEARLPHSGPPSLHSVHKPSMRDMPSLTRIVSCDERDDEDELLKQHRDDWLVKRADVSLERVREGSDATEDDVIEVLEGQAVESPLSSRSNSESGPGFPNAKAAKHRNHFGAWNRNEAGVWTR